MALEATAGVAITPAYPNQPGFPGQPNYPGNPNIDCRNGRGDQRDCRDGRDDRREDRRDRDDRRGDRRGPRRPQPPQYPPQYPPQHPGQPPHYPPGQHQELIVDVNLYRQFQGGERLEIGSLVGLYNYNGYRIVAVEIEGSNLYSDYGRISVTSNNDLVGAAVLTRYNQVHVDYPRLPLIIGRNVGYVQLFVDGNAQVGRIRFRLGRF